MLSTNYTVIVPLLLIWFQLYHIESSVNLALNKPVTQSSYWGGFPSSRAVDGVSMCSSGFTHTNFEPYAWLEINLEAVYDIKRIQIYYRDYKESDRLDGYFIDIIESLNPNVTHQCYKDTVIGKTESLTPSHICRYFGQYVKFSRKMTKEEGAVINLCELEVYGCPIGSYGNGTCGLDCSNGCLDSKCDPDNGTCDCKNGWSGEKCESRPCNTGFYRHGDSCVPCPPGCLNNTCNDGYGECTVGCGASLYGKFCNKTCPKTCNNTVCERNIGACFSCKSGFHGYHCNLKCTTKCQRCDKNSGHCTSCRHPFRGETCTECIDGHYSDNCIPCSDGCLAGKCSNITGHCKSCKDFHFGYFCNQSCPVNCKDNKCDQTTGHCLIGCKTTFFEGTTCTVCKNGIYGRNCDKDCPSNCKNHQCHGTDGTCLFGCKYGNMTGNMCDRSQTDSVEQMVENGHNVGPIIGGVVVSVAVIIIAVVIMLFLKRRRWGKDNKNQNQVIFSGPKTDKTCEESIENGNDYYNSPEVYMNLTLTEVPISEINSIISKKAAEKEFATEYDKLPKGTKHPVIVGKHPENKIKNRFLTTFPYDHSRVILKPILTQRKSDYINANYIDGAEMRHAYIATQGPKTNTLVDFWRMVWQENSGKIVMLTNLIENEKPKCEQYWPDMGQEKDFGVLIVTMEEEKEHSFFFERTLLLTNKKTKETRRILQFHFTMWPDHGTPDPVQLMLFHRNVKDAETILTGPPVVHCAAGIGRTGTFIALDTLHEYGDKTGKIDIFEYVIRMRKDRMNMIQTLEQYIVLHEALLESFQYTGRSLSRSMFLEVCSELDNGMPKNQTHTYKEFQNLSTLRPAYGIESYDSALDKENRRKSRNQNILAVEKYRPYLMSQHSSRTNFINAVMLPTFRKKCGYFATHYPLENTIVDFWCMVFDHDSSTIVVLDAIADKDSVLHWYPTDEIEMDVGSFTIKKVSGPHMNGKVREIDFTVTHQDDEKSVRMLTVRPWPTGRFVPQDKTEFLKMIEMTMERQRRASGPVTIVCSDGACCCGLFCTVSNIILNLRIEDEIDIFHTVRQLQIRRPQFITDYEEYKGCYEMIKVFLDSSNVYANV